MPNAYIKMTSPEELANLTVSFNDVVGESGRLQQVLEEFGCAIVSDVMSADECSSLEGLWGQDLCSIIDKDASNPLVVKKILSDPVYNWRLDQESLGDKFVSQYGLPQGQFAWAVRSHPNVKRIYESIYGGEKELCCGTDTIFFNNKRPSQQQDSERENNLWPHIDQNINMKPEGKWDIYQGVMYVWGVTKDCSTTVVWPGSHKLVDRTGTHMARGHFVRLPNPLYDEFVENARRVLVPLGSFFLWNSRVVHQGWSHGPRLAVPVCFEPKSRRSEKALESKMRAVSEGGVTTHWASLGIVHPVSETFTCADGADIALSHKCHEQVFSGDKAQTLKPSILALL